jgi:hypothetical protein
VDYEQTGEDALPDGSTLSGNKARMDEYPEDEAKSKKNKTSNTSNGKKGNSKHKKLRRARDDGCPMRGQPMI